VLKVVKAVSPSAGTWLLSRANALGRRLLGGHRPTAGQPDGCVRLEDLAHDYWSQHLGLPLGGKLRPRDLQDLTFSTLGDERARLLRFRSVTSLCRGLAAIVALGGWAFLVMLIGPWPTTSTSIVVLLLFLAAFWALTERGDMYDGLWNEIILPQFMAIITPTRRSDVPVPVSEPVLPARRSDGGGTAGKQSAEELPKLRMNPVTEPVPGDLIKAGTRPEGKE
jgi:hypothetical protein